VKFFKSRHIEIVLAILTIFLIIGTFFSGGLEISDKYNISAQLLSGFIVALLTIELVKIEKSRDQREQNEALKKRLRCIIRDHENMGQTPREIAKNLMVRHNLKSTVLLGAYLEYIQETDTSIVGSQKKLDFMSGLEDSKKKD